MTSILPFSLSITDDTIDTIKARVAAYPWHEMPDDGGWDYGTNLNYMQEFCHYWVNEYDWRKHEAQINRYSHFKAPIDGIDIHFIHERGSGPNPKPLIISHGWPGSIVEFLDFIDLLAHPEKHGGKIEDAFDVVAPSLPGYGFSGRPPRPWGPRKMASVFNKLMTDVLGYEFYIAQGGDWGGAIASWLGFEYSTACKTIHINILTMRHKDGPQSKQETDWTEQFEKDQLIQNGYRTQQATNCDLNAYLINQVLLQ